ncbi:MAG: DUF3343 domain-containing protein [Clostridia bacterium]|nr:DUF3343 domain-containing protein [Clostridia bacterium]
MYYANHIPSRTVLAAIGSMTGAVKAQRALLAAGIAAEVVALAPEQTRRGCAYGVEFSAAVSADARATLRTARIAVSQYIEKDTPS